MVYRKNVQEAQTSLILETACRSTRPSALLLLPCLRPREKNPVLFPAFKLEAISTRATDNRQPETQHTPLADSRPQPLKLFIQSKSMDMCSGIIQSLKKKEWIVIRADEGLVMEDSLLDELMEHWYLGSASNAESSVIDSRDMK